jgi:type I restriction enzyme S subunit
MSSKFKNLKTDSLPSDWSADFFGNLVDYKLGKTPPRASSIYWKEGQYPWVSISDMTPHGVVTETAEKVSQEAFDTVFRRKLVPAGSLLMSFKLTIGRMSRLGVSAFHNEAIISFRPDPKKLSEDYISYYLSQINYKDYQDTAIKGQTLNKGKLSALEIALPPLPEQKKIAYILSTVQRAIEAQERIIQTTTELKKALMHKLFTEGLRNEPQKQSEIGPVPESWDVLEIGDLGKCVTGSTPKTKVASFYDPPSEDFIAPADLGARRYVYNSAKKISPEGMATIRPIPKNAVMCVCIGSSIGKVGMSYRDESATNQQINSIICKKGRDPEFVYYLLSYHWEYWKSFATFGPVPILSKGRFATIVVAIPSSVEEQQDIAKPLVALETKVEVAEKKVAALQDLFRTLLHELMTAKTRVHELNISA